jgi:quercetin dioxygenase-like cupin family protein
MAIPHAASGDLIDIRPLGANPEQVGSSTLIRAPHLEVFRLVMAAGKTLHDHKAAGAITIQCLEGSAEIDAHGQTKVLHTGSLIYLADAEPHEVRALQDTSLLVTVLLRRE